MALDWAKSFLKNPKSLFTVLGSHQFLNWMSDKTYLKIQYRLAMGKPLDLKNPKTFNEKLQWLKLYYRKREFTQMVDKYEVRKYIGEQLGKEYLIPLVGGPWNSVDEIDFDKLPDQFVLKWTHDSGSLVICRDKKSLNREDAKKKLKKRMNVNYFWLHREWPYKNVKPQIIAEKYMEDESGDGLKDYKFFAFNGVVKAVLIATDRHAQTETCFDFFDEDFNHLPFTNGHPNAAVCPTKPDGFEKMLAVAEKLAKGFPHLRIDLYSVNGKIYFGEITFFHWSGLVSFQPEEWDYKLGEWLELPSDEVV